MAKRTISFKNEEFYHIFNRGVDRGNIFFDDDNYLFFIKNMKRYLLPVMDIIAYCLMPTHYHLLICVIGEDNNNAIDDFDGLKQINCSVARAMQRFSISYTKAINKRYDRVGSIFQGAYKAKHVNGLGHSRRIIPYIHQNPVNAGLVKNTIDWEFSSARVYEGIRSSGFLSPLL